MFFPGSSFLWTSSAETLPSSVLLCPKEAWGGQRAAPVMVLDRACGQPRLFSLRGHVGGAHRFGADTHFGWKTTRPVLP